jgi:serpin B
MRSLVSALAVLALLAVGCGDESSTGPGQLAKSDKERLSSPQVPPSDLQSQVSGSNAFAFDLYRQVRSKPGNQFYSPFSMSIALAMLYAGARGGTEQEMAAALHYVLPQDQLHPVFNLLDQEMAKRGQGKQGADGKPFRLSVINATWGQTGWEFLPAYLDTMALNYGAGLRLLDFRADPETCRRAINEWVEKQTETRIRDLLPEKSITEITRLVLTNAIYFNASWAKPFDEKNTAAGTFHLVGGGQVTVPLMHGSFAGSYGEGAGYKAVALPYDGGELSMLVIVPDAGTFDAFEQSLTGAVVEGVVSGLKASDVMLTLPKFEFTAPLGLKEHLQALGMKAAFDDRADLSGIDGRDDLFVQDVLHKAFVKVNEAGTEAAAATAVIVGRTSIPQLVELVVDRPFIFLIRDHATNTILFVGRVLNPS